MIDGAWYVVTLKAMPVNFNFVRTDRLFGQPRFLGEGEARQTYGAALYAESRRLLGKRELQHLPIPHTTPMQNRV